MQHELNMNSEIGQFPNNNTRKSTDSRVALPGNRHEKNPYFLNISMKTKIFSKIFWGVSRATTVLIHEKKTRAGKSHASVPYQCFGSAYFFIHIRIQPFLEWDFNLGYKVGMVPTGT